MATPKKAECILHTAIKATRTPVARVWNAKYKELYERIKANDPTLKMANFGYSGLTDNEAIMHAGALAQHSTLTELYLLGNQIYETRLAARGGSVGTEQRAEIAGFSRVVIKGQRRLHSTSRIYQ